MRIDPGCLRQYVRIEFKRAFISIFHMLAGIVIIGLSVALLTGCSEYLLYHMTFFEPIKAAVIIPDGRESSELIASAVSSAASVSSICRFEYYHDESSAEKKLLDGQLQAVIILPDDFYNDLNTGVNTPVKVILPENMAVDTALFRETLNDGVAVIRITEAAIYAADDVSEQYRAALSGQQMEKLLTDVYLQNAFSRNDIFSEKLLSQTDGLELVQYFFAAGMAAVLYFLGINFGFLYKKEEKAVTEKLRVYGIGPASYCAVKVFVMTVMLWTALSFIYAAACLYASFSSDFNVIFNAYVLLLFIPAAFSAASFFSMVYSAGRENRNAEMFILMAGVLMLILSGCVIPSAFLPDILRAAGGIMPLTMWRKYLAASVFMMPDAGMLLLQLSMGVSFNIVGMAEVWNNY